MASLNELLLEAGERYCKDDGRDPVYDITTGARAGITFQRNGEGVDWDWLQRARDAALTAGLLTCIITSTGSGTKILFTR